MPIIIKDFTWNQSDSKISLIVPFKSLNPTKADIFFSSRYIKVSLHELFFDVLLLETIDVEKSSCTKTSNSIIFELLKCNPIKWSALEPTVTKQERQQLKQQAIEEEHKRFQEELAEKSRRKAELKKVAVREQIDLENNERETIDKIRKSEEAKALGDLNSWTKEPLVIEEIKEEPEPIIPKPAPPQPKKKQETKKIKEEVPRPRSSRSLQVLFTPREFPTPSRESYMEQENEWLRKQAEARRTAGFLSEDIRPEEKNPQFLLGKGHEFMRNNNYLGAISAYSFGIKLSDQFVDLYIARSEAHMFLGNHHRAINDCSKALELLRPAVPINLQQRALCIGRRGVALCGLNLTKHGISELEASLKLLPDEYFEQKLQEAKEQMNSE